ncbi:MAG: DUF4445 domain-containing protein [Armatimonadetes bacterium]|nr:DUF4445 domain-containing protein [Armatimonadota bacterium]
MSDKRTHRIRLQPIGVEIEAEHGAPLRDFLFEQGVEFPCGGQARCRGCRVLVHEGNVTATPAQCAKLSEAEIEAGWRLSCQCNVEDDLVIELRQWDAAILANDTAFTFTPQDGLGVAVDIGTTTMVAQLLDMSTGHVLGVRTALNSQARFGADIMSRVHYSVAGGGQEQLTTSVRVQISGLIQGLLTKAEVEDTDLRRVVLVGNSVMHHLFCGIDLEPLSHVPFEPVDDGLQTFSGRDLGWKIAQDTKVEFLPCLGGFVGSDILAGILATGVADSSKLVGLVDIGTNGEIVFGTRDRLICASAAAGPAFEGALISVGMRAASGAIWRVSSNGHGMQCEVLGDEEARGICGSGLVDAVAVGLDVGRVLPSGRLADGSSTLGLTEHVALTQTDIRQLQLAKGAIAAGIRIVLKDLGADLSDVEQIFLAGAFGNYVSHQSARRIGLVNFPDEKIEASGNTALLGAKLALFNQGDNSYSEILNKIEHITLSSDMEFQEIYVDEMSFPSDAVERATT